MINKFDKKVNKIEKKIAGSLSIFQTIAKEDLLLKITDYEDKANKFAENFIL